LSVPRARSPAAINQAIDANNPGIPIELPLGCKLSRTK
jgi:hypothetical protein